MSVESAAQDAAPEVTPDVEPEPGWPPPLTWVDVLVGSLVALVLNAGLGVGALLLGGVDLQALADGSAEIEGTALLLTLVASGLAWLAGALITLRHRVGWAAIGLTRAPARALGFGVLIGLGLRALVFLLLVVAAPLLDDIENPQEGLLSALTGPLPLAVGVLALGGLFVPLAEEVFFRGVWFGGLRQHLPLVASALLSGAVFALAHGINIVLPVALLLGIASAVLYEGTRSLWPSVITHVTFNLAGFALAIAFG